MSAKINDLRAYVAGLACIILPGALLAQTVIIEPHSQGSNRDVVKAAAGDWADADVRATAPGVQAPGSLRLERPSPTTTAALELRPNLAGMDRVLVSLAWPENANATGLKLTLLGTDPPQSYPIIFNTTFANQWVPAGVFSLEGIEEPVIELATTRELRTLGDGEQLNIVLSAVKFEPATTAPALASPFVEEGGAPVAAPVMVEDPFSDQGEANPFAENPFGSTAPTAPFVAEEPAAPEMATSPFETEGGTPVTASEVADPFGTTTAAAPTTPADPFGGTTASPADPFGTTASPVADPFGTTAPPVVDPFGTTASPVGDPFGVTMSPTDLAASPFESETSPPADPFGSTQAAPTQPAPFDLAQQSPSPFPSDSASATAPSPFEEHAVAPGTTGPFEGMSPPPGTTSRLDPAAAMPSGMELAASGMPNPVYREPQDRYLAADLIRSTAQNSPATGRPDSRGPLFQEDRRRDTGGQQPLEVGSVNWAESYEAALEKAREENRTIMLIFLNRGSESQLFEQEVLTNKKVTDLLNRAIPVRVTYAGDEPLVMRHAVPRAPYGVLLNKQGYTRGHVRLNTTGERVESELQKLLK